MELFSSVNITIISWCHFRASLSYRQTNDVHKKHTCRLRRCEISGESLHIPVIFPTHTLLFSYFVHFSESLSKTKREFRKMIAKGTKS